MAKRIKCEQCQEIITERYYFQMQGNIPLHLNCLGPHLTKRGKLLGEIEVPLIAINDEVKGI